MRSFVLKYPLSAAMMMLLIAGCNVVDGEKKQTPPPAPQAKKLTPKEEAQKQAAEKARLQREYAKMLNERLKAIQNDRKLNLHDRLAAYRELAKSPHANRHNVYVIYTRLLGTFSGSAEVTLQTQYGVDAVNAMLEDAVREIVNDPRIANESRLFAWRRLVDNYCGREMFAEAEKAARTAMSYPDLSPRGKADAALILADVYRFQDKLDQCIDAVRQAMKYMPAHAASYGARVAWRFNRIDLAAQLWKEARSPVEELLFYSGKSGSGFYSTDYFRQKDDRSKEARAFVMDTRNSFSDRFRVAKGYCFGDMKPENTAARATLKGLVKDHIKSFSWTDSAMINAASQYGDYPLVADLCEIYAGTSVMRELKNRKLHVMALGACGRNAEAVCMAEEYAGDEKLSPVDRARFRMLAAILAGKNTDQVLKDAGLNRKEESLVLLTAARYCLVWEKSDLAEKFTQKYQEYFIPHKQRTLNVTFSNEPVTVDVWRKKHSGLEKQYCDIPYQVNDAFLIADVATGERDLSIDKDAADQSLIEITAVADRAGLHIFMRSEAENAESIRRGFGKGVTAEMYFAPGHGQPYTVLGYEPGSAVTYVFPCTYNNKLHTRLDKKDPQRNFDSEEVYTAEDYVLHLFFSFDAQYNRLPENGSDWRFEVITRQPNGKRFCWGGSRSVHQTMMWGNMRFNLTEKQLDAIRREIIFKAYKGYANVRIEPGVNRDLFRHWEDEELGDPEFARACLAPLEKELKEYAALVKEDMSSEDVKKVYVNALPRWKGLIHEIDELRRKYLKEQHLK